jgi:hypothetical protein
MQRSWSKPMTEAKAATAKLGAHHLDHQRFTRLPQFHGIVLIKDVQKTMDFLSPLEYADANWDGVAQLPARSSARIP